MNIDLQKLNYSDKITIDEKINYSSDYLDNTDIIALNDVLVSGSISNDLDDKILVNLVVKGSMMIHDSVNYDLIPYDFEINIEENLENSLKTLDLIEFLWHYIVLEIPIRYTLCEVSEVENDNYRIISEEEYNNKDNPFKDFFLE